MWIEVIAWVGGVFLILVGLYGCLTAWISIERWCHVQMSWFAQIDDASIEKTRADDSCVLTQREHQLKALYDTPLAEGSLGALLLRRDEVPGEYTAEQTAQLLVTFALVFTIMGLIVTLGTLGGSLSAAATVEQSARTVSLSVTEILESVREPLTHLSWVFLPTGVGLLLAIIATWVQNLVDNKINQMWKRIDRRTLEELIPSYLKSTEASQQEATENLVEASKNFLNAAIQTRSALTGMEANLEQISKLDQSKWAQELIEAANEFRGHVATSAGEVSDAAWAMQEALEKLPDAASSLETASGSVNNAADRLMTVTTDIADALESVGDAFEPLSKLPASVNDMGEAMEYLAEPMRGVARVLNEWSVKQQDFIQNSNEMVKELRDNLQPLLENARNVNERSEENFDRIEGQLEEIHRGLERAASRFDDIVIGQAKTLSELPQSVESSIRSGHEAWIVEANERFEQDGEIFEGLMKLRDGLGDFAERVSSAQTVVSEVSERNREAMESISQHMRELNDQIDTLKPLLERERPSQAEEFQEAADQLAARFERALQPMAAMSNLHEEIRGLREDVRALQTNDSEEESKETEERPSLWDRLLGRT